MSFESPAQAELLSDIAQVDRAQSDPDIHCPYCDARNPSDATTCKQCGGDLGEGARRETGEVVGAFETVPDSQVACPACGASNAASSTVCASCGNPLPRADTTVDDTAKPRSKPGASVRQSSGCIKIAVGLLALVVIAFALYLFFANQTETSTGTVVGSRWSRGVTIEGLIPVARTAWKDEIPQGAAIGQCRREVRDTVEEPVPDGLEVCGTPYTVDKGTGYGEVVQDCEYQVLDDMCEYEAFQWQRVERATEEGNDLTPRWPTISLGENQREGEKTETYQCLLVANDETYVYRVASLEQFAACVPGSRWNLEINTFNEVVHANPSQ